MNPSPQAVTERYVSNLIHNGRNREFDIRRIDQQENIVEEVEVGRYHRAFVMDTKTETQVGVGATIAQAVRAALTKHGVTFR